MRHTFTLFLLLWPALACGQIPGAVVLGGPRPTVEQVQQAKNVLAAAEEKEVIWNVGEFDVLVRGATAKGEVRFDSTDESVLMLDEIPAGVVLWLNDIRAGQKDRLLHKFDKQGETYWVARAAKEGRTTIKVWANGEAGKPPQIVARLDVRVGKPKPPTPPTPDPDNPPGPAPIIDKGLRVLIVRETKEMSSYPSAQVAAMNAREVVEYLNAKCVKVNGQPEHRVFDPDQDVSRASKVWQDAMKIERKSLPWIIISDGEKGTSEPLPPNTEELLKLLKTYGGN
jgi:hypothetical protein